MQYRNFLKSDKEGNRNQALNLEPGKQSLRYIASYILFLIYRSTKNVNGCLKKAVIGILEFWGGKNDLKFCQHWNQLKK